MIWRTAYWYKRGFEAPAGTVRTWDGFRVVDVSCNFTAFKSWFHFSIHDRSAFLEPINRKRASVLFKRERKKNKDLNNGYRTTITTKLQKEWCKRIPLIEFPSKNLLKSLVSSLWSVVFIDFNRWAVFSCDISLWRRLHLWDQFPDLLLPPLGPRLTLRTLNFSLLRNRCSLHLWRTHIHIHTSADILR